MRTVGASRSKQATRDAQSGEASGEGGSVRVMMLRRGGGRGWVQIAGPRREVGPTGGRFQLAREDVRQGQCARRGVVWRRGRGGGAWMRGAGVGAGVGGAWVAR